MGEPRLCEALRDQKRDVEKLGFALCLLVRDRKEVEDTVHRICSWMDDAIEFIADQTRTGNEP